MLRDPPPPEWPSPELENNARAAFDSAGFFNHFHVFPGRREPLQRTRQGVPRVHLGGGSSIRERRIKVSVFMSPLRLSASPHLMSAGRRYATATTVLPTKATPGACRLYNIPLHRTGLEEHPIPRVAIRSGDSRVQTEPYDTGNLKRRTWPIYLIHCRFAESPCKIALSFPRCASIPARTDSRTTGTSCTWAAAPSVAPAWSLRKQPPSRARAASPPRTSEFGRTRTSSFFRASFDS